MLNHNDPNIRDSDNCITTVQEMINQLSTIEDKSQPIKISTSRGLRSIESIEQDADNNSPCIVLWHKE